jgi:hypothetical protein
VLTTRTGADAAEAAASDAGESDPSRD